MKKGLFLVVFLLVVSVISIPAETKKVSVESMPPVVVKTVPQAGDTGVDPGLTEIKVTFSKEMLTDNQWSFVKVSNASYPKTDDDIHFLKDKRTCVLPVKLESGKTYVIWINRGQWNFFKDTKRNPAIPYLLVFKTR